MNRTSPTPKEPTWGAPAAEPAHWSRNKSLAAVGIAAVLAAGGALVIHAADTGRGGPGGPDGRPGWGPPPGGFDGPAGMTDALHGEFVVSDGRGGYNTELTQTGTVTDISSTAITARSADGFTATYVITTDTKQSRQSIHPGDTASIRGVERNGTQTATVVSPAR